MTTEQQQQIEDARAKAYSEAATQYRTDRRQAFLTAEENNAFKSGFKAGYAAARSWVEKSPVELAELFHATYELLAPQFGYETREETREFDPESPNGKLMIAVCRSILDIEPPSTGETE